MNVLPTEEDRADPLLYEVITTSEKASQTEKGQSNAILQAIQRASETAAQAYQATARNTERILDELRRLERRVTAIERGIDSRRRDQGKHEAAQNVTVCHENESPSALIAGVH